MYRQLYETLVEVDCEGRARPGLAATWSQDGDGRHWRFTLRRDARFWDGSPVTAHGVVRAWASRAYPQGSPEAGPAIASASVEGQWELTVLLTEPSTSVAAFARPAFAVTGESSDGGWPLGTGPFRPRPGPGDSPQEIRLIAVGGASAVGAIAFWSSPVGDPRAALDAGADALVSIDPAVIAYARALPDFTTVPLPWSGTYVVAAPPGRWAAGDAPPSPPPAEALDGLARGAVRAEARPAEPPFWWKEGGCASPGGRSADAAGGVSRTRVVRPGREPPPRIVYPLGDAVARGIAERLVALAGRGPAMPSWLTDAVPGLRDSPGAVVAAGMEPTGLARAAREADALAFVVSLPRAPGGSCLSELLALDDPVAGAVLAQGNGLRVTPLVEVRPSLVIRRGVAGVSVHGDGTLSFHPGESKP